MAKTMRTSRPCRTAISTCLHPESRNIVTYRHTLMPPHAFSQSLTPSSPVAPRRPQKAMCERAGPIATHFFTADFLHKSKSRHNLHGAAITCVEIVYVIGSEDENFKCARGPRR